MIFKNIKPRVCICIPAYNAEATIAKTLNSLINQTYKNIIIYVIDNNSADNTVKIVEKFCDKYSNIVLCRYKETVTADKNFDRCIEHSDGAYTCIFHSDDVYLPTIIEKEVQFLSMHKNVGAVFTYANVINEKDKIISKIAPNKELLKQDVYNFKELFPLFLKFNNCFVTPSAMVRTEIYKEDIKKHKRNEKFGDAFDVDVWLRILKNHDVGFIFDKLMNYRLSVHSTSFRKFLEYKNTIGDGMFVVLKQTMIENNYENDDNLQNFSNLENRNKLANVFKAYVCADYHYAKSLIKTIDTSKNTINLKIIKCLFRIMLLFKMPIFVRKIMLYIKYRNIFEGQFLKIILQ